ncbi:MAG: hypothetical protein QXD23_01980 [Candidatus Micrarchaeaceae archaeon]
MPKNSAKKIKALHRAQEIESMLKQSIIESEALQSSGDDHPEDESHINALLNEEEKKLSKKPKKKKSIKDKKIKPKKKRSK